MLLSVTSETNILVPDNIAPIKFLKLTNRGISCTACKYCCIADRTFSDHWNQNHAPSPTPILDRFTIVPVQTIYYPFNCRYFKVNVGNTQNPVQAFDVFLTKEIPTYPPFSLIIPNNPREIPPLLFQTQWHVHLEQFIKDKKQRLLLLTMVNPGQVAKSVLWKLVWNYLIAVRDVAKNISFSNRCLLEEYPR